MGYICSLQSVKAKVKGKGDNRPQIVCSSLGSNTSTEKKELAGLDRRIRYLQKRIPELTVVDKRAEGKPIFIGAPVVLESNDKEPTVRIVGRMRLILRKNTSVLIHI